MNFVYALGPITFNDCKLIAIANCSSLSFLSSLGSTSQIPNIFACLWYCLSTISTLCQDLLSTNFRGRLGCNSKACDFSTAAVLTGTDVVALNLWWPEKDEQLTTLTSWTLNVHWDQSLVFFFQDWQCALVQPGHQCHSRSDIRSFQSSGTDFFVLFLHPNTFWKAFSIIFHSFPLRQVIRIFCKGSLTSLISNVE